MLSRRSDQFQPQKITFSAFLCSFCVTIQFHTLGQRKIHDKFHLKQKSIFLQHFTKAHNESSITTEIFMQRIRAQSSPGQKYLNIEEKYRTAGWEKDLNAPCEKIHQLLMQKLGYCLFLICNSGNGFQRGNFKRCWSSWC